MYSSCLNYINDTIQFTLCYHRRGRRTHHFAQWVHWSNRVERKGSSRTSSRWWIGLRQGMPSSQYHRSLPLRLPDFLFCYFYFIFSSHCLLLAQIFEAEQANLHAEPLVAAQVLSDAIACICLLLFTTARDESLWIRSHMLQHSTDALSLIMDGNRGADWVGGNTYHKEIFVYLYGALQASATIEERMKNDLVLACICDKSHHLQIQKSQQMIEEDGTHPWVKYSFEKLRLLSIWIDLYTPRIV